MGKYHASIHSKVHIVNSLIYWGLAKIQTVSAFLIWHVGSTYNIACAGFELFALLLGAKILQNPRKQTSLIYITFSEKLGSSLLALPSAGELIFLNLKAKDLLLLEVTDPSLSTSLGTSGMVVMVGFFLSSSRMKISLMRRIS